MSAASKLLSKIHGLGEATSYALPVKDVLTRIESFCKEESDTPNNWSIGSRTFFFEWPVYGETEDGSVEGVVYEKIGNVSKTIGSYFINGDGKIVSFPFLPKDIIDEVNGEI